MRACPHSSESLNLDLFETKDFHVKGIDHVLDLINILMSPSPKEGQHYERESNGYADYYHDEVHDEQLEEQYWCDPDQGFHTIKHTDFSMIFRHIASLHERLQGKEWH